MVRTRMFHYMRPSVTPSLHRNGRMPTRRDRDGSGDCCQGVGIEELVNIAGCAMTTFVATGMTTDVETFPGDDSMESDGVAAFVTTLPALSNNASVAELAVNRHHSATM